jgi:GNAT superfamily N-acetyltransferase
LGLVAVGFNLLLGGGFGYLTVAYWRQPIMTSHLGSGTSNIRVREATPADWPAVAALLADLGRPDVRVDPDREAQGRQDFERYLNRPDAVALVAERDGQVVGFLDIEFRSWLNRATRQAWIPDLVVDAQTRGQGIGGALLTRAEEVARSRGCWGMALESADWREAAHRFYEAHGWQPIAKHFTKDLADKE